MTVKVRTGADLIQDLDHPFLRGKRVGLVTNPTGITSDFRTTIEVCSHLPHSKLTALFAGEHGLYGERQAGVFFEDEFHSELNIPVFSLYGKHKRPTAEMLAHVDTIIFDMQDIGIRFYTYLSTLFYIMESCAASGKALLVLDRVNPLGGEQVEGGLLQEGYESFVGAWYMPIRTGMTIGEIALMRNQEERMHCDLDVVKLAGWTRGMEFTETGLPWMIPSPNMPTPDAVRVYAGTCLFEGTNLSEGRGTTRPFEWIGAPWIDGKRLADQLNSRCLPGVHFHPVYITPMFSKHQGTLCGGVRLFVTDPLWYRSVETGLVLLHEVINHCPEKFEWLAPPEGRTRCFIDLLTGGEEVRSVVANQAGLSQIMKKWKQDESAWKQRRKPYLLYGR
ncbi:DUF1343 domain-containing protein [Paenibacillus sp. Marseille-Q4541]|uniref:exo-beta-N-acetylmuramidase NamZ family protein n=1 Tax=Paenibacillus sp. Marseille-Q4541 TaxID=2831522 RepID=UPI001BAD9EDD|nr:DUF1343 domain-containing protein [Paenibacillus sp. Marseille-Q4541]